MPIYQYQGDLAQVSMRTKQGAVVLKKGEQVEISAEQHKVLQSHKAFKALIASGEILVQDDTKPSKAKAEPTT